MRGVIFSSTVAIVANPIHSLDSLDKRTIVKSIVSRIIAIVAPFFCAIDALYYLCRGTVSGIGMTILATLKHLKIKHFTSKDISFACTNQYFRNAAAFAIMVTPVASIVGVIQPKLLHEVINKLNSKATAATDTIEVIQQDSLSTTTDKNTSTASTAKEKTLTNKTQNKPAPELPTCPRNSFEELRKGKKQLEDDQKILKKDQQKLEIDKNNFKAKIPDKITVERNTDVTQLHSYADNFNPWLLTLDLKECNKMAEQTWDHVLEKLRGATKLEQLTLGKDVSLTEKQQTILRFALPKTLKVLRIGTKNTGFLDKRNATLRKAEQLELEKRLPNLSIRVPLK